MNDLLPVTPLQSPQVPDPLATSDSPRRDLSIDVLRGLAVFTMVAANLAASALEGPHPLWFRLYGSFAAPLFVLLSGMMVAYTMQRKAYGLRHFAARGAMVIAIAALLEVAIWKFYPFMSVDVLYLIGVSLPLVYLAQRLSRPGRWTIVAINFLFTPILQQILGYADYPTEVALSTDPRDAADATSIFNHWLLDGWFPLFPWFGFALLGAQLADLRVRQKVRDLGRVRALLATGVVLFVSGIVIWWMYPGDLLTRGGYSELFYPPTPGFIITASGLAMMLLATIDWKPDLALYRPLRLLGESALLMYLLHIVLIKYVVVPEWEDESLETFMLLYAGMVIGLLVVAYAGRGIKSRWRHLPLPVRVLLGN
jgi:uncharacterized membrane protein